MSIIVRRGDIFYADLSPVIGVEQDGVRPVVIIQNDVGNRYSPSVIVAPITSQFSMSKLPTHVAISANDYGLNKDSIVRLEQVRIIDKIRLRERIDKINQDDMIQIDEALALSLGFDLESTKKIEFEDIKDAINILKAIAKKHNIEGYYYMGDLEKKYQDITKEALEEVKNIPNMLSGLSEEVKNMVSPVVERQKIAKGKLTEHAVIEYFENNDFSAEKAGDELDHLKIDVISNDEINKIFTQVKSGQVSAKEIVKLVSNVVNLDSKYDTEGLKRVADVSADTFPPNSYILRIRLEREFKISIMFIHKYQVLEVCPEYKSTVR